MATLPQYQQQATPRPIGTPYDETRVTPDAFGAPAGEALQQGAQAVAEFARVEKAKQDAARVVAAEAQLGDVVNSAIYDPKAGFVTRRGTDALAAYQPTVDGLAESRKKILGSLANDEQRNAFLARSNETMHQAQRQVEAHTYQQSQEAAAASFRARETTSYNTLANVAFDPAGRASEMDQVRSVIVAEARATGATPDVLKAMLQGYEAKAHATVLDQMLAKQQATAAKEYFDQNRAALGTVADDYEKRVREVGIAQQGEANARALLADPANRMAGGVVPDPARLLAKVGQMQVPVEVKDATLQRALHYANVLTQAQDDRSSKIFGRAMVDLDTTGLVNPNDLAYLQDAKNGAGKYFDTLKELQRRNLEQEINAPPTVAQEAAFGKAQLAIGADQREFWATQSYEQMAGTFAPTVTRAQLGQLRQELDGAHKWADEQNRSDRSQAIQMQVKDRLVKSAGFNKDPTKWSDDQWTIYSRSLTDVKVQQRAFLATKKDAQPTPDDVKKWIDLPLAKVKVVGSGFLWDDSPVRAAAETLPQYQGKQSVFVIPSDEKKLIDRQLGSQGLPVTDQTRQSLYRKRHGF